MDKINCSDCAGRGRRISWTKKTKQCWNCDGVGYFPTLESQFDDILKMLIIGKKKKRFRASAIPFEKRNNVLGRRAYYIWRLTRYHGGQDVTMPIGAITFLGNDPERAKLDKIADMFAKKVYGTDLAAAYRWKNALGGEVKTPDNLPPSAYSGGPVVLDNEKPFDEQFELC